MTRSTGLRRELRSALAGRTVETEARGSDRTYRLRPVEIPELGFVDVYDTDVTAEKWVGASEPSRSR